MYEKGEIIAWWLYCHPNKKISEYRNGKTTHFWYDDNKGYFYCQTPENKVHNGIYRARGMDSWLYRYCNKVFNLKHQKNADNLEVQCIKENDEVPF